MIKKIIINNTITFVIVMFFVITFKSIFGEENTLIGVTTITATLMFLERDFTGSPLKNTFKIYRNKLVDRDGNITDCLQVICG